MAPRCWLLVAVLALVVGGHRGLGLGGGGGAGRSLAAHRVGLGFGGGAAAGALGVRGGEEAEAEDDDAGYEVISTTFHVRDVVKGVRRLIVSLIRALRKSAAAASSSSSSSKAEGSAASKAASLGAASRAAAFEGVPLLVCLSAPRGADKGSKAAAADLAALVESDAGVLDSVRNGTLHVYSGSAGGAAATLVKTVIRPRRYPVLAMLRCDSASKHALLYRHSCNPPPADSEALKAWLWAGRARARGDAKLGAARERYLERQLVIEQQRSYLEATVADRTAEAERSRAAAAAKAKAEALKAKKEFKKRVKAAKAALDAAELRLARTSVARLVLKSADQTAAGALRPTIRRFSGEDSVRVLATWLLSEGVDLAAGELSVYAEDAEGNVAAVDVASDATLKDVGLFPKGTVLLAPVGAEVPGLGDAVATEAEAQDEDEDEDDEEEDDEDDDDDEDEEEDEDEDS